MLYWVIDSSGPRSGPYYSRAAAEENIRGRATDGVSGRYSVVSQTECTCGRECRVPCCNRDTYDRLLAERQDLPDNAWPWVPAWLHWSAREQMYDALCAPCAPDVTARDSRYWYLDADGCLCHVGGDGQHHRYNGRRYVGRASDFGPSSGVQVFAAVWEVCEAREAHE